MRRRATSRAHLGAMLGLTVAVAFLAAGCGGAPILANEPLAFPSPLQPSAPPARSADPIAISLPRDDGPHDRLTEWWYYTGHLGTTDGRRFGFEAVVFRAERGSAPAAWAAHLALTDEQGSAFHYAQRAEIGPQVDQSPRDAGGSATGFDLRVGGLNPALIAAGGPPTAAPWTLTGSNGVDRIEAALAPAEAAAAGATFGLALDLRALKPPVLHQGNGFVDFGPAGSSYYYSRTRLAASGELQLDGQRLKVEGIAWFDHQWGDFVSVGGGWNWFAINLDDGTDLTISSVFGTEARAGLLYGTLVDASGGVRLLDATDIQISASSAWASAATGRLYPTHWRIAIAEFRPGVTLVINLLPTVDDQELDTRATTGVVYWEGSELVSGLDGERPLRGEAYVELTRYDAPDS